MVLVYNAAAAMNENGLVNEMTAVWDKVLQVQYESLSLSFFTTANRLAEVRLSAPGKL